MLRCMSSSAGGKLTTVEVNDKTGIATLTMNRPPVNGLNLELLRDIHDSIDEIESNKCRGLILTSVRCSEKGVYYDIFQKFGYILVFQHYILGRFGYYGNV